MFKKALGYVEETELLGEIAMIDIRNGKYVIAENEDAEEGFGFDFDKVEVLEEAFEIHGIPVFHKDVLGHINGKQYQVELVDEDQIRFHELNARLEIVRSGQVVKVTERVIDEIEQAFDIQGNLYELIKNLPQKPEFTVELVKDFNNGYFTYYYALNNKEEEEIDLVSAVFLGGTSFGEYARTTVSYQDYMTLLEIGDLVRVSDNEFANYVTGMAYSLAEESEEAPFLSNADLPIDDEEEDFEEDVNEDSLFEDDGVEESIDTDEFKAVPREQVRVCNICKKDIEDCDCLWN